MLRTSTKNSIRKLIDCPSYWANTNSELILAATWHDLIEMRQSSHQLIPELNLVLIPYKLGLSTWFQTFAVSWMLYAFFWVIPQRLNFICRRFGTLCPFHLHRQVGVCRILLYSTRTYLPMEMEWTVCSETSAYKIQTPGNHPKESIQQLFHSLAFNINVTNN